MQSKLRPVKCYYSEIKGEEIFLALYKKGNRYGVATVMDNAVIVTDYKTGEGELHTFAGNAENIIDWTSVEIANTRYLSLLRKIISQPSAENEGTGLRLVHG